MKCEKCGFENADSAAFCSECGAALGYRCVQCGQPLKEGMKFCPRCGVRCDGKRVCPVCGTVSETDARYCSGCGRLLVADTAAGAPPKAVAVAAPARRPAKTKDKRTLVLRILDFVRGGVVAALAIAVFVCSFFGVFRINIESEELTGSFRVSSLDIIEGAFSCVDPMPGEERLRDFLAFLRDELPADVYTDYANGQMSESEMEELIVEVAEKYNILKIVTMKELIDLAPNAAMSLGFLAFFAFALIGLAAAFLIVSVLSLIYLVTGRRKGIRASGTLAAATACAVIALIAACGLVFDGIVAGCALTVLICSLVSLLCGTGYSIGAGEIALDRRFLFSVLSAGVNAALIVTALSLCVSSVLTVRFTASDELLTSLGLSDISGSRKFGYTASDLMEAWSALRMAEDGSLEYGGAATYYTEAVGQILVLPLYMARALASPALAGVLGRIEGYENALQILGIFLFVVTVLLIVMLCVMLCRSLTDAACGRRARVLYNVPAVVLAVCVLTLTIVYGALVNRALDGVGEGYTYKAGVSAAMICCVVFSALSVVQAVVFRLLGGALSQSAVAQSAADDMTVYATYNPQNGTGAVRPADPAMTDAPASPSERQESAAPPDTSDT